MKKYILFLSVVCTLFLLACDNKADDNNSVVSVTTVNASVITSTWRITYFFDSNKDETSNFTGYNFTFANGGVLTATKNTTTVTGSWSAGNDNSKTKLIISFASPATFAELSEDWEIIEFSPTKIKMRHISGGGGGTDLLTIEKN